MWYGGINIVLILFGSYIIVGYMYGIVFGEVVILGMVGSVRVVGEVFGVFMRIDINIFVVNVIVDGV